MALVFFSEFCKISKNTFFFTEHLLTDDWLQNFRKHVALVSQPFTQLIQQGCLTITRIKNYMQFDVTTIFMLSLLPFRVFFPTHFKPRLSFPNTPLLVANLLHVQWTLSRRKKSSVSLFNDQVVIFPARNPPQKCFRANLPVIIIPYFKNYYTPQEL